MSCSIPDHVRAIWAETDALNSVIPVSAGSTNRFFEAGLDLSGFGLPYAVLIDTGTSSRQALGDNTFFEILTFLLRIYSDDKTQLTSLSRAARQVYSNEYGGQTDDGCVCKMSIDHGRSTLLPDGTRMVQHLLSVSMAEDRTPT